MKEEAKANADADNKERERIEKINQADSTIFQTENMLKENGDKLPADTKNKIQAALDKLKEAKNHGDIAAIDAAMAEMSKVGEEMYKAAQGAQAGAGQPGANPFQGEANPFTGGAQPGAGQQGGNNKKDDDIEDVSFEEVK